MPVRRAAVNRLGKPPAARCVPPRMPEAPHTPLTVTEIVVAELAAQGKRNEEIADELGVARKTVEWHLSRVYRKLGLRSRTELAGWAARENPWASAEPE